MVLSMAVRSWLCMINEWANKTDLLAQWLRYQHLNHLIHVKNEYIYLRGDENIIIFILADDVWRLPRKSVDRIKQFWRMDKKAMEVKK